MSIAIIVNTITIIIIIIIIICYCAYVLAFLRVLEQAPDAREHLSRDDIITVTMIIILLT